MLICCECGKLFEEPRFIHGVYDCEKSQSECPFCGGTYEEAEQCNVCGEFKNPENMVVHNCCEDCYQKENTIKNNLLFLEEDEKESDFFVNWLFQSDCENASQALIYLCKGAWEAMGDYGDKIMKEYIKEHKEDFAEWLTRLSF